MSTDVKPTGNLWTIGIAAILGTTIVVNIIMATLASNSQVGYIEDKTWEHDQQFQQQIDAEARFRKLGLVPKLETLQDNQDETIFQLVFHSSVEVAQATGFKVELSGKRGDGPSQDFLLPLSETAEGMYRGSLPRRISGLWMFDIMLNRDGLKYRFNLRQIK